MKTFLWVLILGIVAYFLYRRAQDYGFPWESQVAIANYAYNKRYVSGSEALYVYGDVENRTRKRVQATVECTALPEGITITSKTWTDVAMQPLERVPFNLSMNSKREMTGAECRVRKWDIEGGLEDRVSTAVRRLYRRITSLF